MKYLLLALALTFNGCEGDSTYNLPFVPDDYKAVYFPGQVDMCNEKPSSMFCGNYPSIGDELPSVAYAESITRTLKENNEYQLSDHWHYTESVFEWQIRDCEDEAMTMIHHMVDDGIDKKYLYMVYQIWENQEAHMFVGIMTDEGLMHMDLVTGVKPIEAQINWHMPMTNAGINTWIKGNIK